MSDLSMHAHSHQNKKLLGNDLLGSGVFGFAIVVLIVFMVLSFFKPHWVWRNDGKYHGDSSGSYSHSDDSCKDKEVDCMKALLYSVLITVGIAVVLGVLAYAFSC